MSIFEAAWIIFMGLLLAYSGMVLLFYFFNACEKIDKMHAKMFPENTDRTKDKP